MIQLIAYPHVKYLDAFAACEMDEAKLFIFGTQADHFTY